MSFTVKHPLEYIYTEKKSKFIVNIFTITSIEEATYMIQKVSQKYSDATHNVYAYKLFDGSEYSKCSDDGEPKNTAGKPILDILTHLSMINTLIVVSRYFGGIKLGASGLIRAYAKSAKLALLESEKIVFEIKHNIMLEFDYPLVSKVELFLFQNNIDIIEKGFNEKVMIKLSVTDLEKETLKTLHGVLII